MLSHFLMLFHFLMLSHFTTGDSGRREKFVVLFHWWFQFAINRFPISPGSPLHLYNKSNDILYVVGVASYLGREPESYNATHDVVYRCYPGETVYYVLVINFIYWIRENSQNELCTAQDVARARLGVHNYSMREYRSNYFMVICKLDLALFLIAIGLLTVAGSLLFFASLPPSRKVDSTSKQIRKSNENTSWPANLLWFWIGIGDFNCHSYGNQPHHRRINNCKNRNHLHKL